MSRETATYSYHTVSGRLRGLMCVLLILVAALVIAVTPPGPLGFGRCIFSGVFFIGALLLLVDQTVTIATDSVRRDFSIGGGGLRLRSKTWPLTDFAAVETYRHSTSVKGSRSQVVHVGLRRTNGGFLDIRYYQVPRPGNPCPDADAFARELGEQTGLGYSGVA